MKTTGTSVVVCALLIFLIEPSTGFINLDFLPRTLENCRPMDYLMMDPRAQGMYRLLNETGLYSAYMDTFEKNGGTVLVPTTDAFKNLLSDLGTTWENLLNVTSMEAWIPILGSYFLANITYLPKDVGLPHYVMTAYGTVLPGFAVYGPTEVYQIYQAMAYIDDLADNHTTVQLRANFIDFKYDPGMGSVQGEFYGQSGVVLDYAYLCRQYIVYWMDEVVLPAEPNGVRDWYTSISSAVASQQASEGAADEAAAPTPEQTQEQTPEQAQEQTPGQTPEQTPEQVAPEAVPATERSEQVTVGTPDNGNRRKLMRQRLLN